MVRERERERDRARVHDNKHTISRLHNLARNVLLDETSVHSVLAYIFVNNFGIIICGFIQVIHNESDMEYVKFYALSADLFIPCSYLAVPVQLVEVIHIGGYIIPH